MSIPGTVEHPLRVAVIGSGPAAFYTVQHLFQSDDLEVTVDMYDRLFAPFGLVRYGVAPDHPKIKSVTAVYDKLASDARFRFFGSVEYGRDIMLDDLRAHYHQIVFCTGAQTDRHLGIPGEDLVGSHPATEFVAWYNGHPDFAHLRFDLGCEQAVVVGVGNVAVDVARILCRDVDSLARTDIAEHALDALAESRVREVYLLGRRGPAQAAFTNPEIKELAELPDTETSAPREEIALDPLSQAFVREEGGKALERKLAILQELAGRRQPDRSRKLVLRFLVSPTEILDDGSGCVRGVRIARNELYRADGKIRSRSTDQVETLDAGLVFRSVGYHGVPLPELPFRNDWGIVPNDRGRIVDPEADRALTGLYVSGWIKRGPTGVIGTNRPDAQETVASMLEDRSGSTPPQDPSREAVPRRLEARGVGFVSYDDWKRLDALEVEAGKRKGRPRVKFVRRDELARALLG